MSTSTVPSECFLLFAGVQLFSAVFCSSNSLWHSSMSLWCTVVFQMTGIRFLWHTLHIKGPQEKVNNVFNHSKRVEDWVYLTYSRLGRCWRKKMILSAVGIASNSAAKNNVPIWFQQVTVTCTYKSKLP